MQHVHFRIAKVDMLVTPLVDYTSMWLIGAWIEQASRRD
jgi:hypothetical protein